MKDYKWKIEFVEVNKDPDMFDGDWRELEECLRFGWEPFAVTEYSTSGSTVWTYHLRRKESQGYDE